MNAPEVDRAPSSFQAEAPYLAFGPFRYDVKNRLLLREGKQVPLPARVGEILDYLLQRPGDVVGKGEVLRAVWNNASVGEDSLSKAVSLLRSALEDDPHDPDYVQTVPTRGYRFIATLRPASAPAPADETETAAEAPGANGHGGGESGATPAPGEPQTMSSPSKGATAEPAAAHVTDARNRRSPWVYAVLWALSLVVAFTVGGSWNHGEVRVSSPASEFSLTLSGDGSFQRQPGAAVSPDGSTLVFTAPFDDRSFLHLRPLDELRSEPLRGTGGARYPFYSPDGNWVGFFADDELRKVSLASREVSNLAPAPMPYGGSWGRDEVIVFSSGAHPGLLQVPAGGGEPRPLNATLANASASIGFRFPQVLDDSGLVMFSMGRPAEPRTWSIAVVPREGGEIAMLVQGSQFARYSPSGHLFYTREDDLLAVELDLQRLDHLGDSVAVRHGVLTWVGGPVQSFGLSARGVLVYVAGSLTPSASELFWVDANGRDKSLGLPVRNYVHPRLSPDGSQIAVTVIGDRTRVWIADLARLTMTPLGMHGFLPVWIPGEDKVVFTSHTDGGWGIFQYGGLGIAPPQVLLAAGDILAPSSATPDGSTLGYTVSSPRSGFDVWVLDLDSGDARPFLESPANESVPAFSPDGNLLAYVSDETGDSEVFVISYPDRAWKRLVSTGGGTQPRWAPGGRLFYRQGDRVMEVGVGGTPDLAVSAPREWFRFPSSIGLWPQAPNYDVAPDGDRLLMLRPATHAVSSTISLVVETGWDWLPGVTHDS